MLVGTFIVKAVLIRVEKIFIQWIKDFDSFYPLLKKLRDPEGPWLQRPFSFVFGRAILPSLLLLLFGCSPFL
jgi:hypothetical protein